MRVRTIPLVLLLLSPASVATAAPPRPADDVTTMARVHFSVGRGHVQRHEYQQAMKEFELGYQLKPLPLFLYNIGRVAQVAGLYERSLEAFEQYLERYPRAPECREVRWWVATLRQRVAEEKVAVEPPPSPAPPPPPSPAPPAPANLTPPPPESATVVVLQPPPSEPERHPPRRRALWITLGTVGGVLVAGGAVALGVVYGTRAGNNNDLPSGYHDLGRLGVQGP
jgi:tetratricopeptide (TPR) repeat protein